jgi:hypothetical protein
LDQQLRGLTDGGWCASLPQPNPALEVTSGALPRALAHLQTIGLAEPADALS